MAGHLSDDDNRRTSPYGQLDTIVRLPMYLVTNQYGQDILKLAIAITTINKTGIAYRVSFTGSVRQLMIHMYILPFLSEFPTLLIHY